MQPNPSAPAEPAPAASDGGPVSQIAIMADRSAPAWARGLSLLFSAGAGLCLIGVAIVTVFLGTLVAEDGNRAIALSLGLVGLVPIIGALIFDFAHTRALAGYTYARLRNETRAQAAMAAGAWLILTFVHPTLGVGIIFGAGLSWVMVTMGQWLNRREPMWDFRAEEAVSVLSGRDATGLDLAARPAGSPAMRSSLLRACSWAALLIAFSLGSWLVAMGAVALSAVPAVALITFWSVGAVGRWLDMRSVPDPLEALSAARVDPLPVDPDELERAVPGALRVRGLTVMDGQGRSLLTDLNFDLAPGSITCLMGGSSAGKSLLLQSLIAPGDLDGLHIRGRVMLNDVDLWQRRGDLRTVPAVWLPPEPLLLPASGGENLSCFHGEEAGERARRILENLVFSRDAVDEICDVPNAQRLAGGARRALGFARAFALGPALYLIDRPEDGSSDKLVGAICDRLQQEARAGRAVVVVSSHRTVTDMCDRLMILAEGRIADHGPADEIRGRMSSGWARFSALRRLEAEENLESWIRSHFKRDGDEANRRKICMVAFELLAFSCLGTQGLREDTVIFEFKHFEGHCMLRMLDRDAPLSTGQLERARAEIADEARKERLSPLAAALRDCDTLEAATEGDRRVLTAKILTYDPRKSRPPAADGTSEGTTSNAPAPR